MARGRISWSMLSRLSSSSVHSTSLRPWAAPNETKEDGGRRETEGEGRRREKEGGMRKKGRRREGTEGEGGRSREKQGEGGRENVLVHASRKLCCGGCYT